MAKKRSTGGIVYSTDPDFSYREEQEEQNTLPPSQQRLKVKRDTKHRAGKVVTLVEGFTGRTADLETLGKELKTKCGSGGSVKDGMILIQGDYEVRVKQLLKGMGYGI